MVRREKERKREKPSRELDGSRATIRRGDFTERGSCWSSRRRHKRGSETDSVQEKETEKRGIHTQKKKQNERQKKKQDTGSGLAEEKHQYERQTDREKGPSKKTSANDLKS